MPPWIVRCALLCLGLLPLGCKEARRQPPPPPVVAIRPSPSLTPAEALLLPEARWIDVRTRAERSQGYLPGSLLLPLDELPQRIGELDAARQQPLILVCASGARAQQAATLLRTAGFPQVHVLQGGMLSWNGPLQAPRLDADGDGFQDRFPAGLSLLVVRQPDPEHPLPGLEVHTVYPGGPAHRKLHTGEVITAIDDRPLDAAALAVPSYKNLFPATGAALRVRSRDGTEREVRLPPTPAEPPPSPPTDPPTPRWPSPVLEALRSPEGTAFREVSRRQTRAWLPSALPLPASLLLDPARFGALLRGFPLPSLLEPAPVDRTVRQILQELHTLLGSTGEPTAPRGSYSTPEAIAAMVREAQQLAGRALEGLTPAEQRRLAGLAGRRRGALERRAFLHDAADVAERDELIELAELGWRFHTGRCVGALEHLSRAVEPGFLQGVKAAWRGARPREAPEGSGVEGSVVGWLSTPQGPVVLGGPGPNRYRGAFLAIVDVGGDDRYELQAGQEPPLLLDLEGNDRYEVEDREGPWPVGRATLLADLQGDDFYGSSLSGLGYGYFGAAALVEAGGDDRYEVERSGLGAGRFGAGVLLDMGGHDRYQGGRGSQGFGGPGGVGMLVEVGGDDRYTSRPSKGVDHPEAGFAQGCGMGLRELSYGGVGVLLDRSGGDRYEGRNYGQGVGYFGGLGLLLEGGGGDAYEGRMYSQGAGVHGAVGLLWDRQGDDRYELGEAPRGQGMAWDLALAALVDEGGNDEYGASGMAQGYGAQNGLALLVGGWGRRRCDEGESCGGKVGENSYAGGRGAPSLAWYLGAWR